MGCTLEPEALSAQHQAKQDRETLWECMQERLDEHAGGASHEEGIPCLIVDTSIWLAAYLPKREGCPRLTPRRFTAWLEAI